MAGARSRVLGADESLKVIISNVQRLDLPGDNSPYAVLISQFEISQALKIVRLTNIWPQPALSLQIFEIQDGHKNADISSHSTPCEPGCGHHDT
jgi:hypothetical protein